VSRTPNEVDTISKASAISLGHYVHAVYRIVDVQTEFIAEFWVVGLFSDLFERSFDGRYFARVIAS